jgi:hypothetical protein
MTLRKILHKLSRDIPTHADICAIQLIVTEVKDDFTYVQVPFSSYLKVVEMHT